MAFQSVRLCRLSESLPVPVMPSSEMRVVMMNLPMLEVSGADRHGREPQHE